MDGVGCECVSSGSWMIVGLMTFFLLRLSDGDVVVSRGLLDGGFFSVVDPSMAGVVDDFFKGNEDFSLFVVAFGSVNRSGGGGPCC